MGRPYVGEESMTKRNQRYKISHGVLFFIMLILGITMIIPFVWSLSSSFKNNNEIFSYPITWVPNPFRWSNYQEVWSEINFLRYVLNTLKVTVIVTAGQVVTCSLAAYAFSKMHFPGRDKIFLCFLATLMIPWHAIMIPQFVVVKSIGLYDSHWSLIFINMFSAFGVFLLRQFMLGIPEELSEAARIDGYGEFSIFSRIIFPMCKPGIATLIVFTFNFVWNDYMAPMIYLTSDDLKTIQIGLASFRSQYGSEYGLIMAGTICALIPMLILFVVGQKYLVKGIAFSGLKG